MKMIYRKIYEKITRSSFASLLISVAPKTDESSPQK